MKIFCKFPTVNISTLNFWLVICIAKYENDREWALLARYVYTYEEFVIVTEAPQCNRMTATGQDTDNKE